MRRLGPEEEEAAFIVDMEFKRINPLLQMQNLRPQPAGLTRLRNPVFRRTDLIGIIST